MLRLLTRTAIVALSLIQTTLFANEFEKKGTAIAKALGSTQADGKDVKVFKRTTKVAGKDVDVYYSKKADGKPAKFAVLQQGTYPPDCTHTWVVGLDAAQKSVEQVRVVEMSCPHAFPTNKAAFLDQYKGASPKNLKALKGKVNTIAKATGTSDLTTVAVTTAVTAVSQLD